MVALSSISAAHMCVGAKPHMRRGQDYQWPCLLQRRVAFSLPVDINSLHPLQLFCELDIWDPSSINPRILTLLLKGMGY